MCGIAGAFSKTGNFKAADVVRGMLPHLAHRGPDAEGVWDGGKMALGHRRLKIIDLSDRANQPYTDGKDVLVFNGEIFNYKTLRDELTASFEFRSESDTEVLFRALQHWGTDCLRRLNGQFAFGFFRKNDNTLTLARDHAGICPLYTCENDSCFFFASEMSPILALASFRLDRQSVVDYFRYRYNIQNGRTFFEGISRFTPGSFLSINLSNGAREQKRYWRLEFSERRDGVRDMQDDFNNILDEEISLQSMADVPVGLYLSGGIDSGALLAGFAKNSAQIKSFTMTFSDDDPDEKRVEELSRRIDFERSTDRFNFPSLESLNETIRALEEPFGDLIISANHALAKQASMAVRVVLSGEGGDEAFCGYDHQRAFMKMFRLSGRAFPRSFTTLLMRTLPARAIRFANSYPGGFGSPEKNRIAGVMGRIKRPGEAYLSLVSLFDSGELARLFTRDFMRDVSLNEDRNPILEIFNEEKNVWRAVMRAEVEQLTLIVNLLKQDRFTMSRSIEGRVPFVSRRVLEFAASLPFERMFSKVNKPFLLNYAGQPVIKKKPFSLFADPAYAGHLKKLFDAVLTDSRIEETGTLDAGYVRVIKRQAEAGGMLAVKKAMAVLVFACWMQVFGSRLRMKL